MADDSLFAKIRRSGWAGQAQQEAQKVDDVKARGYTDEDAQRTQYENVKAQQDAMKRRLQTQQAGGGDN